MSGLVEKRIQVINHNQEMVLGKAAAALPLQCRPTQTVKSFWPAAYTDVNDQLSTRPSFCWQIWLALLCPLINRATISSEKALFLL